jgi:hypothetical protein
MLASGFAFWLAHDIFVRPPSLAFCFMFFLFFNVGASLGALETNLLLPQIHQSLMMTMMPCTSRFEWLEGARHVWIGFNGSPYNAWYEFLVSKSIIDYVRRWIDEIGFGPVARVPTQRHGPPKAFFCVLS